MKELFKIGITGGIASGKTIVCKLFEYFGIPVYNADFEAKKIILSNLAVKSKIIKLFGKNAYTNDGAYNVSYISSLVSNDRNLLNELNQIIHPEVRLDYLNWAISQNEPLSIFESALLPSSPLLSLFCKTIIVRAPLDLRISWLKLRNNFSEAEALKRIEWQHSENYDDFKADFEINNDLKNSLIFQTYQIYKQLKLEEFKS